MGTESSQNPGDSQQGTASGERLTPEWEIAETGSADVASEEDVLQRLDRLEQRLDAFENTCYSFLLYANQSDTSGKAGGLKCV